MDSILQREAECRPTNESRIRGTPLRLPLDVYVEAAKRYKNVTDDTELLVQNILASGCEVIE